MEKLKNWRALQDVALEREKQRQQWGDDHDDKHTNGALACAAGYIALPEDVDPEDAEDDELGWAVRLKARNPDRRRQLVIAAALLVAEIERLDRALAGSAA